MSDADVLIVGGGPVGLAAAIELGIRGIPVLLVEQNDRAGLAPRAKTTNVRTRTHLRRWGIADRLAQESPFGVDHPNNMIFVTRLGPGGHELARFPNAFEAAPVRSELFPEHGQWIPQYKLEKVLLEKVRTLSSVEVRFGTRFVEAEQDTAGVTSVVEADSGRDTITSRYLIGADGARSLVRDLIGAKLEGRHGIGRAYNIIFRAPGLAKAHAFGKAAMYWQVNSLGGGSMGPMDRDDIWFFMPGVGPDVTLTSEQAADMIRERTGIDLPYEILSADAWFANDLLADRYADRRMILAGDACHLHPPLGGYGMNMGVSDGVDVGWKIAATLQGWGGPNLVASYEAERRPIHRTVIDEAISLMTMAASPFPPELALDTPEGHAARERVGAAIQAARGREFYTLGTVLGLGYENSPIVAREPGPAPAHDSQTYVPTARPGYLAPHAWLGDGRSLYDALGRDFTLLVDRAADPAEMEQARAQAAALGVPMAVIRPDGVDVAARFEATLVLIRPDQHVAWRGHRWTNALARAVGAAA